MGLFYLAILLIVYQSGKMTRAIEVQMLKSTVFLFLVILIGWSFMCHATESAERALEQEFEHFLSDGLLHIWYPRILDHEQGGYLTNFAFDWTPLPPHPKVIVSQTRGLWASSKAAERYPHDPRYLEAAQHGFEYLKSSLWDHRNGGFYFTIHPYKSADSMIVPFKRAYGQAFAIYALSAYARLTGSSEALELAQKTFFWLETHSHDDRYGGYFDWTTVEGKPFADLDRSHDHPFLYDSAKYKDYNSSIHLLEAFTELYKLWPDPLLNERLEEMFLLLLNTFVTEKGYLQLHFQRDWSPVSIRDSSKSYIETHWHLDHVSFGHDIETAYLLYEASLELGLENDPKTRKVCKKLVDHTLMHGFDQGYQGIFQVGYYFPGQDSVTILNDDKNWWAQAEGLNALLLFSRLYSHEPKYKDAFLKLWDYVKTCIIDNNYGGWYPNGIDTAPEAIKARKAQGWKSCYHNGRALMNGLYLLENHHPPR